MKFVMIVLGGIGLAVFANAKDTLSGKVVRVIDGNTVEVADSDHETYKIMLHGIDCPELGQEFGEAARQVLEKLLLNKSVNVEIKGKDRWGTRLGVITIEGEEDPRHKLLKEGLAWTLEVNPDPQFEALRDKAREKGKGLWKQPDPLPPWIYRRQQTMLQPKTS